MRRRLGTAALLLLVTLGPPAVAAVRHVAPSGADEGNDCAVPATPCRSLPRAFSVAVDGDEIRLARGRYVVVDPLVIDGARSIAVTGRWSPGFVVRLASNATTVIVAPLVNPIRVAAGAHLELDGVRMQVRGGAGIDQPAFQSDPGAGGLVLRDVALKSAGGGIRARGGDVALHDTTLQVRGTAVEYAPTELEPPTAPASIALERTRIAKALWGVALLARAQPLTLAVSDSAIATKRLGLTAQDADAGGAIAVGMANTHVRGALPIQFSSGQAPIVVELDNVSVTRMPERFVPQPVALGVYGVAPGSVDVSVSNTVLADVARTKNGVPIPDVVFESVDGASLVVRANHSVVGAIQGLGGGAELIDLGGNLPPPAGVRAKADGVARPVPGAPVVDAGTCAGALTLDFEGDPRPSGAGCDIGADEVATP